MSMAMMTSSTTEPSGSLCWVSSSASSLMLGGIDLAAGLESDITEEETAGTLGVRGPLRRLATEGV